MIQHGVKEVIDHEKRNREIREENSILTGVLEKREENGPRTRGAGRDRASGCSGTSRIRRGNARTYPARFASPATSADIRDAVQAFEEGFKELDR